MILRPLFLVLFVAIAVTATATDLQARETEEEAIKKYLESQKGAVTQPVTGSRDYRTPVIYEHQNGDSTKSANDRNKYSPDNGATQSDELKPFGYEAFDAPASDFFVPSEAPVPQTYVLGPGDALILNLWGRVEKSYELTVDREGKVFVPKSGEVTLWGLTVPEAETKLRSSLSKIYTDFELGLVLGKIKSIKVYVFGAVRKPGAYTVSGLSTLFNVLYLSGGPDLHGSLRNITLSRSGKVMDQVDLYEVMLHGKNIDIRLANDDVIFVPVTASTAAIRGRVRRPAIYELIGGERVADMIDLAGGLDANAYLEKVSIRRIEDNLRHVVLSVDLDGDDPSQNIAVANGDTIDVYAVYDTPEKYVELRGWVKYGGTFAYNDGMRVSDLLEGQLRIDSYLERVNILRSNGDVVRRLIAVDLKAVLEGDITADLVLKERDVVTVYSQEDIHRVPYISIEGQVRRENRYELTEKMRMSDLIFLSGGVSKSAFLLYAEIARVGSKGYSNILHVDLKACLESPEGDADVLLREDDKVFIREIPEWKLHDLVQIDGEVRFPGRYAIASKHEMLSELLPRAGGVTDDAFLKGAVFERPSIEDDIRRRNIMGIMQNLQEVSLDSTVVESQKQQLESLRSASMRRIVVNLDALFNDGDKSNDIELRDGDRIYIPATPSGVHVMGAVASSGTIQYIPKSNYKFYIYHAGGLVKSADKGEIRVVKPDGRVFKDNLGRIDIDLGDSIVVPKKIVKQKDWWKIVSSSLVIVSSAVTTAYLVVNL
jgi:polysaccharide export outer membrane protein